MDDIVFFLTRGHLDKTINLNQPEGFVDPKYHEHVTKPCMA